MNKIKQILVKNIWLKISIFNSSAVFVRIISSWIINKFIAIYIGPEGTSISEQFRNFLQTVQGISTLGTSEGVTRYSAKYQNNKKQLTSFLASTYKIVLITSIVTGIFIIVFSDYFNQILFGERNYSTLIILLGVLLPVFSINVILLAILNGFQKYKKITYINIISNIIAALLSWFLIVNYTITGALLLILITQIINFVATLLLIKAEDFLNFSFSASKSSHYKRLYAYIIMALVSAIIIPLSNILIRNLIFNHYTDDNGIHAGYWDGVKKISGLLLTFVTPIFSLYYYPQLAKIKTNKEFLNELKKFFKQIFPLFFVVIILLYLFRHWATIIFFSKEYIPMEKLFFWQLAGDFIRLISLSIAYLMLARAHIRYYISTEVLFWGVYYLFSYLLLPIYGVKGIVMAYFLTYILYFFVIIILFKKVLFSKKNIFL